VTHDALTGLLNRRELLIRLEQALRQARNGHNNGAMLYIDLDQFKVINDHQRPHRRRRTAAPDQQPAHRRHSPGRCPGPAGG